MGITQLTYHFFLMTIHSAFLHNVRSLYRYQNSRNKTSAPLFTSASAAKSSNNVYKGRQGCLLYKKVICIYLINARNKIQAPLSPKKRRQLSPNQLSLCITGQVNKTHALRRIIAVFKGALSVLPKPRLLRTWATN
ncbi:hypothetical protein NIES4071_30550 [Calothrix sp. NIES-4071]|nr:hypothetical protein NIES4071_30550 [Calothrix sp. NIES-4071]BAZ57375.1 hypothetical protein NIES4105_30490 [Calothrix sp. NIES-4105]